MFNNWPYTIQWFIGNIVLIIIYGCLLSAIGGWLVKKYGP